MSLQEAIRSLARLNGAPEAGIAAGVDPSLPADLRVAVTWPEVQSPNRDVHLGNLINSVIAAHRVLSLKDPGTLEFLLRAAFQIGIFGFYSVTCDMRTTAPTVEAKEDDGCNRVEIVVRVLGDINNNQKNTTALTLVLATKVNWWSENHHTGQGGIRGYARKALIACVTDPDIGAYTSAMHTAGHWACTKAVLTDMGVTGINDSGRLYFPDGWFKPAEFKVARDLSVRVMSGSVPAGSAAIGVAVAATRRLLRHPLVQFCPGIAAIMSIATVYAGMATDVVRGHIGSYYLCGRSYLSDFKEAGESVLGILGTFMKVIFPNSTVSKSPLFGTPSNPNRYQEYDDYDADFHTICTQFKVLSAQSVREGQEKLKQLFSNMATVAPRAAIRMDDVTVGVFGESCLLTAIGRYAPVEHGPGRLREEDGRKADDDMDINQDDSNSAPVNTSSSSSTQNTGTNPN